MTAAAADEASWAALTYSRGLGNLHESEARAGALPPTNNPQIHAYYAEQLSGAPFTAPNHRNHKTWLYRTKPSAARRHFKTVDAYFDDGARHAALSPHRWGPLEPPQAPSEPSHPAVPEANTFVRELRAVCGAGSADLKQGLAIYMYAFEKDMHRDTAFSDADGSLLLVPQHGTLRVTTEMGRLTVEPGEIAVLPRNVFFNVARDPSVAGVCRGYVLEVYSTNNFQLPERGPIGANGLAEPRDFLYPTAWSDDPSPGSHTCYTKRGASLGVSRSTSTPFNVVAWRGSYAPYKYDLRRFVALNSVTVDHPDPSIFTVLTVPSAEPGVSVADLVVFPPRWSCAEGTFRPPYYHVNCMSEFMGLIDGEYDAKRGGKGGFVPGGASLHAIGVPHGPDAESYAAAVREDTSTPRKIGGGLAFMFETMYHLRLTDWAMGASQPEYMDCWEGLPSLAQHSA